MADQKMVVARLPPLSGGKISSISPRALRKLEGLNGPTYRLHEKLHPLPPPNALKPYVDTQAGAMDTWPAHCSGQALSSTSAMLAKDGLVLVNEEEQGKPQLVPRPRFLEQLDAFLKKELRALGVTQVTPSDLRLQAHREVFEYLIEDFKTYKPLLSAIKNEYEMMLAFQRQQIRQLEPLKQMLVTVSEQCEQKIMAIREDERGEMSELKQENKRLYGQISKSMNVQKDLQEQVNRLQLKLSEEYHRYRDECDARKLLVADINDLRYQQEDFLASKNNASNTADPADDPVLMKISLQKAREGEKYATKMLNEMKANYGDVIPRRDFEALEKKFKELETEYENAQTESKKLQAEYNSLKESFDKMHKERDNYYIELTQLQRSSTPRPDWNKCAECVQGGIVRWQELAQGKRSDQLVDVLLSEIQSGGIVDSASSEYFDGMGTGEEVPLYLRHEGPVRNRRIGKRDTALLVKDIWRAKSEADAKREDGTRQKMSEFVSDYLKGSFPLQTQVVEWSYNLHDAVQRYDQDESLCLFKKVLNAEADEEIYHSQLLTIHRLLTALSAPPAEGGDAPEVLPRAGFVQKLQEFFPSLTEASSAAIMKAVDLELEKNEAEEIDYKTLFTEDDEGKTGPFLDEIKKFMKEEKDRYVSDIKSHLDSKSSVSVDELKQAIVTSDPGIDNDRLTAYCCWAFAVNPDVLGSAEPAPAAALLARLTDGNVQHSGK